MKILIYFLLWSFSMFIAAFVTIILIRFLMKLVFYFETETFNFGLKDFISALEIGSVAGIFLGIIICFVSYLENKRR